MSVTVEVEEMPHIDWRSRRRAEKEAAREEVRRQQKEAGLVIRQATPEERLRYGIDEHQARLATERAAAEEERRRVDRERARAARSRSRAHSEPDPEMVARLQELRALELAAPAELDQVMAAVLDRRALTTVEIAKVIGISRSSAAERIARARRADAGPVEIVDAAKQLEAARDRELDASAQLHTAILGAYENGVATLRIGELLDMSDASVRARLGAAKCRRALQEAT